ncbi:MAG: hypothetical protein K2Y27_35180 [Xanthobacteraceae bacterium]|nr:hypothetical protein [Xanthobacteraceae bacterium]
MHRRERSRRATADAEETQAEECHISLNGKGPQKRLGMLFLAAAAVEPEAPA